MPTAKQRQRDSSNWDGLSMTAVGVALDAGSIYAHSGLSDQDYTIFIGLGCGSGMILAGLWLRRA